LTKGKFTADSHKHQGERLVTVFDVPEIDGSEWIFANLDVKYDTIGLLMWPFGIESKTKFYCFQIVEEIFRANGMDFNPSKKPV
jgi:hypothetical protein